MADVRFPGTVKIGVATQNETLQQRVILSLEDEGLPYALTVEDAKKVAEGLLWQVREIEEAVPH